ncbi:MAG: hypothetical protein V1827_05155 [Candidatus Micrarchaeota archaeon]
MVKKHNMLRTAGLVMAIGIGTGLGWGTWKDHVKKKEYAALVEKRADELRGCKFPKRVQRRGHCLSDTQELEKAREAKKLEDEGKYREAGRIYALIGHDGNRYVYMARRMAGKCKNKGDTEGWEMILKEIKLKEDAVRRAIKKGLRKEAKAKDGALAKDLSLEDTKDSTQIKAKPDAGPMLEGPMPNAGVQKPDAKAEEPIDDEPMEAMAAKGKPKGMAAPKRGMPAPMREPPMAPAMEAPARKPPMSAPRRPAEMEREIPLD